MKELKMKDLVLEHYRKVYETEMDGVTVRVFKPKTMTRKLPTYGMLSELRNRAKDANRWAAIEHENRKVQWWLGNPDYGVWDAQLVRRFDPRTMTLDIYFAALLIRPFSKQAFDWYGAHSMVSDPVARLMLMWDSREFDVQHGYDTSFGTYSNMKELAPYIYNGKKWDVFDPVDDPKFDPCFSQDEEETTERRCVKFKVDVEKNEVNYEAVVGADEKMSENATDLMRACAKVFYDLRTTHPEVTEMHFYTDEEVMMEDKP